jgi:hypothetical protein
MNKSYLSNAFNEAMKELREDPRGFVISFISETASSMYLRAALEAIIEDPEDADLTAQHALEDVERFSEDMIEKSLGIKPEGALN